MMECSFSRVVVISLVRYDMHQGLTGLTGREPQAAWKTSRVRVALLESRD
jgi:hypothetical protein